MARIARIVVPGAPHHIVQRGNLRQPVFFGDDDYRMYLDLMAAGCKRAGAEVWAYCLMPSQVRLIVVPPEQDALRAAIADAHRRYARHINTRRSETGHLWQDRYGSFPMDDSQVVPVARYVETQPVSTGLVKDAGSYRWSSAPAHLAGHDAGLLKAGPVLERAGGAAAWRTLLNAPLDAETARGIALHETTGRPLGSKDFVGRLEKQAGRALAPRKRGPKAK